MVDSSISNNKMNNHLSPHIIEHKKAMTYGTGNPGPGTCNMHKNRVGIQLRCQPSPLDNSISNGNRYKQMIIKLADLLTQKDLTHKNE